MPIPGSQIRFSDINTNIGNPNTNEISASDARIRFLANGTTTQAPTSLSNLQNKSWIWTSGVFPSGSQTAYTRGGGVATDSSGNVYTVSLHTFSSAPSYRVFITKTNPLGNIVFVKYLTASSGWTFSTDTGYKIIVSPAGNIYVTTGLLSGSNWYYGVTKFNSSGVLQWSRYLGSVTSVKVQSESGTIALDSAENVYSCVCDMYDAPNYTNGGSVIAKWNSSGVLEWQKKVTSLRTTYWSQGGITVDTQNGAVYLCGYFAGTGGGAIVGRFDTNLNSSFLWTKKITGDSQYTADIAINPVNQNVYAIIRGAPSIMKFDNGGTLQWQKNISGVGTSQLHIAVTNTDDAIVMCSPSNATVNTAILNVSSGGSLTSSVVISRDPGPGGGVSDNATDIVTYGNTAIVAFQSQVAGSSSDYGATTLKLPKGLAPTGNYGKVKLLNNSGITLTSGTYSVSDVSLNVVDATLSPYGLSLVSETDVTSTVTTVRTLI